MNVREGGGKGHITATGILRELVCVWICAYVCVCVCVCVRERETGGVNACVCAYECVCVCV